jgi:hypothetical protein
LKDEISKWTCFFPRLAWMGVNAWVPTAAPVLPIAALKP